MQSDSLKSKEFNEILDMIITRMTEYGIREQRNHAPEIDALIEDNVSLSVQVKNILGKLDEDSREVLVRYYEQSEKIADVQIKYLYIQGAKDCVQLLKKLGAFD